MNQQDDRQENEQRLFHEVRLGFNALIGAAQIMSRLIAVFLRWPGSWGERFAGFQMVLSWIICFVWAGFFPGEDPRPMFHFFLVGTGGLFLHRTAGMWRRSRGYEVHSLDGGNSIVGSAAAEVVLVLVLGFAALIVNKPLGAYLLTASAALWISGAWQRNYVVLESGERVRYSLHKRPDSPVYLVRFKTPEGGRPERSTGCVKKPAAIEEALRIIRDAYQQKAATVEAVFWDEAKQALKEAMLADGKRARTVSGYLETLNRLVAPTRNCLRNWSPSKLTR